MPTINRLPKKHYPKKDKAKKIYDNVYNTALWRSIRSAYLMEHPLCETCLNEGKTTPATDVHHIYEISNGDTVEQMQEIGFDYSNLMALCEYHHNLTHHPKKTK